MATTTTSLAFNTPTPGTEEDAWGTLLNANWDKVDDLFDGTTPVVCIRATTPTLSSTALDPDGGQIFDYTMTANTTFTDSFADGDTALFHLLGGDTYTPTWPSSTWVGGAPISYTAEDVISIWKRGSTLYLSYVGSAA